MIHRLKANKDLFYMVAATLIGSGMTLAVQLLLSYFLSPDVFGEIRLMHGYFLLIVPVVMMAAHAPLGRLCIQKTAKRRWRVYWHIMIRYWRFPALGITTLLGATSCYGLILQNEHLNIWLAILFLAMPLWALLEFYQYFWKYTRERQKSSLALIISRLGLMGGACIGALFTQSAQGFVVGFVLGGLCGVLILHRMQGRFLQTLPLAQNNTLTPHERSVVKRFLPNAFLIYALSTLALQIDTLFLDHMGIDTTTIGLYGFALMFANAALLLRAPLSSYFLPELGQSYDENLTHFIQRIFMYQAFMTLIIIAASVLIYLMLPAFVIHFFKPEYLPALAFLPPLLLRVVIQSSFSILAQGLFVFHAMRLSLFLNILWVTLTAVLSYIGIQHAGVMGLIYAKVASDILMCLLMCMTLTALYFYKKTQQTEPFN